MCAGLKMQRGRNGQQFALAYTDVVHTIATDHIDFTVQPAGRLSGGIQLIAIQIKSSALVELLFPRCVKVDVCLVVGLKNGVELDFAIEVRATGGCAGPIRNRAEPEVLPPVLVRRIEVVFALEGSLIVSHLRQVSQVGAEAVADLAHIEIEVVVVSSACVI